ncbi:MAG TPA: hypothetical protein VM123_12080 [archaeon]|nr:hypothetical protein [archaeon]
MITIEEELSMKTPVLIVVVFAFIFIPFLSGCNRQISLGYNPQMAVELYQHGLYQEEVERDLFYAINIYMKIVNEYPLDIWIASKAQVHILLCYIKLNKQEQQRQQAAEVSFLRIKKAPENRTSFFIEMASINFPGRDVINKKKGGIWNY